MNEREELRKWLVEIISQGGWVDQHEVDVKGQVNAIYDYVDVLINSEVLSVISEIENAKAQYGDVSPATIQSIKNRYKL